MKVSDYIVEYLIDKGVNTVFGYPGGMVTHLMDSLSKREKEIHTCINYHEQGAAFAACGYAQAGHRLGVAFATSGPGATNLVTGICNAYFDSVPVLFITGQVNTYEGKKDRGIRQCGFQETDIVSMVKGVTKYAVQVEEAAQIRYHLDRAVYEALSGRPGAVLLDVPMDIFRADVDPDELEAYSPETVHYDVKEVADRIREEMTKAEHPVFLFGNGVKLSGSEKLARSIAERYKVPVVTSMIGVDILGTSANYYGFVGAYGNRAANFIVAKADLIISIGSRMDIRQVGKNRAAFAPDAKILRVDIDQGELAYKVHEDELSFTADARDVLQILEDAVPAKDYGEWIQICDYIRNELQGMDDRKPTNMVRQLLSKIPAGAIICTDVGQNQVWVSQAASEGIDAKILFSGSMGAMGYSLPAAIGASYATGQEVYVFTGDGGLQMNLQELQVVSRDHLPVKVILVNNEALGMIRHFQEMYFDKNYCMTVTGRGFSNPDYSQIAKAYNLPFARVKDIEELGAVSFSTAEPEFTEICLEEDTYVFPKLEYGKPNQDQEPLIDREKYALLMDNEAILAKIRQNKE